MQFRQLKFYSLSGLILLLVILIAPLFTVEAADNCDAVTVTQYSIAPTTIKDNEAAVDVKVTVQYPKTCLTQGIVLRGEVWPQGIEFSLRGETFKFSGNSNTGILTMKFSPFVPDRYSELKSMNLYVKIIKYINQNTHPEIGRTNPITVTVGGTSSGGTSTGTTTTTNTGTQSPTTTSPSATPPKPVDIAKIDNPFGGVNTFPGLIARGIDILLGLIVIAAVVVIVVAGFRMVAGGSSPEQLKKAKSAIVWAILGLLVAFMSFAIVQIIQRLL